MRRIGVIQEAEELQRFIAFLHRSGARAIVYQEGPGWAIWAEDEDRIDELRQEFEDFLRAPEAERYALPKGEPLAAWSSEEAGEFDPFVRLEIAATQEVETSVAAGPSENVGAASRWRRRVRRYPTRRVYTLWLVLLPVLGGLFIDFNLSSPTGVWMAFCDEPAKLQGVATLQNIRQGEVWRFWSPSFAYVDVRHMLFGVVFLYYFGVRVESLRGPTMLLLLVLGAAFFSNIAQAIASPNPSIEGLAGGANFAGMSSVAYALFAFVLVQSLKYPQDDLQVDTLTVAVMIGWLGVCIFNPAWEFGNIGHIAGLMFGVVTGYLWPRRAQ